MFGLESQKKKKPNDEFIFELEKDLKNPVKHQAIKQKVEEKLQKIKEVLRSGDDQNKFEPFVQLMKILSNIHIGINHISSQ